jgi:hypothetical protein
MLTVYIWDNVEDAGHASMKITRTAQTKFYSWWPAGGSVGPFNPAGRAGANSSGARHPRKNPVGYGNSKLDPKAVGAYYDSKAEKVSETNEKPARQVAGGVHNPGGNYVVNRSDKSLEEGSATHKFFFRPSSGLSVVAAEIVWQRHLNKATGVGSYNFIKNNCSTLVLKALQAAVEGMPNGVGKKMPQHKGGLVTPQSLLAYCKELAKAINNDMLRWSPPPAEQFVMGRRGAPVARADLPPVIMALGKSEGARYRDPQNDQPIAFGQRARHEPHP